MSFRGRGMEDVIVQSVVNAGVQSLQNSLARVDQAAAAINQAAASGDAAALAEALVQLKVAETEAQAGVAVVDTAGKLLGSLIDVRA